MMNTFDTLRRYSGFMLLSMTIGFTSCNDNNDNVTPAPAPPAENEGEVITDLKLIFTNTSNSNDSVIAKAQDPDGEGVLELMVLDSINLDVNKTYALSLEIMNNLESPGKDLGKEIAEEDYEHQFFFGFSTNAFKSPTGNGNIDNGTDPVNYNDEDSDVQDGSGNPVGLMTTWTTASSTLSNGTFNLRLQHQPDGIKSSTSSATDGDTDIDINFVLNIN